MGDTIINIANRLIILGDQIVRISGAIDSITSATGSIIKYTNPLSVVNEIQKTVLGGLSNSPIPGWFGAYSSGNGYKNPTLPELTQEMNPITEREKSRTTDNRQINVTVQQEIAVGKDADEAKIKEANKQAAHSAWTSTLTDLGLGF